MNKKLKIILIIVGIIIVLWGIVFLTDYNRCLNLKRPIFAVHVSNDEGLIKYLCVGYRVEAVFDMNTKCLDDFEKVEMFVGNTCIARSITDSEKFYTNEVVTNDNNTQTNESDNDAKFRAIVTYSDINKIEVKPIEENDLKLLSDKIVINLGDNNDILYSIGQELLITYTGYVMETYPVQIDVIKIQTETDYKTKIEKLPSNYTVEQAISDNCVVTKTGGEIKNIDELNRFLDNVNSNQPDFIRCISFTIEGDMIITDVTFEGNNSFRVCLDSTRDKFSSSEDRIYRYFRFSKIDIEDTDSRKEIYLKNALEGDLNEILVLSYSKN